MKNIQWNGLQRFWSAVCRFVALTTFAMGFGLLATPTSQAQFSGAIFTTDIGGTVDKNIYATKPEVYLQGGPIGGGPGLPSGSYYCQVTTPNGGLLGKTLIPSIEVTDEGDGTGHFIRSYQLIDIVYTASSLFTTKGFDDTTNNGGEYKVWISKDPSFANSASKTDNFKVNVPVNPPPPPPPPPVKAELCAVKFYDANANGTFDINESQITDWLVAVTGTGSPSGPIPPLTLSTPSCTFLDPGVYSVAELNPIESHWIHTAAIVDNRGVPFVVPGSTLGFGPDIVLVPGDHVTVTFGNVCIGAGGGKTLGFWSNKNGQKLVGSDDFALLVALNLRDANGAAFDPTAYAALRAWLLGGTATNMSYMLSVQLTAMELNVHNGLVNNFGLVYAPELLSFGPVAGLNSLGFISVNDLMAAANAALFVHPTAYAGDPARAYLESLKNALDRANNDLNFVQATPCPFSFVIP